MNLNDLHALVIDMDGVLWRGDTPLPGLSEFFGFLYERELPFMLATNNASKTPEQYLAKFNRFGVTVARERVLTSSLATAAYLQNELEPGTNVYVVGQDGLIEAMRGVGFNVLSDSSQPAGAVVAGIDFTLTYDKLKHAAFLIQRGARFVGSNVDLTFPSENGLSPGAGAILAAIEASTNVKPTLVGKPNRLMFDIAVQKLGSNLQHTAMLGDRLETDVLMGLDAGMAAALTLTGATSEATAAASPIKPTYILHQLSDLLPE